MALPGAFAAAVETAASMGGLIMPPMMGIGAFLMSQFLGVPYWDVVARGFALAAVYYISLALAVYLLCVRLLPRDEIVPPPVVSYAPDSRPGIFFLSVLFLIVLMSYGGVGELLAAPLHRRFMFALLLLAFPHLQIRTEGSGGREGIADREYPPLDRDAWRHDVLSRRCCWRRSGS